MAREIKHGFISVKDIFQNKWYKIPEYQRPYVWGKEQVDELLEDIMNEAVKLNNQKVVDSSAQREYFLGSLVWKTTQRNEGVSEYEEYEILDGQQRLTTMMLIHAVIRDLTDNDKRKSNCAKAIFQDEDPDYGAPERLRIVYETRSEVHKFIESYVKVYKGTLKTEALRTIANSDLDTNCAHMAEVILAVHEYFSEDTQGKINTFFGFFSSNTKIIYISASELDDAFHLFNVMNSRGIKLRNCDILKARNLSKVLDEKKRLEYAKKWEQIENYFEDDFDQFLEYIRLCIVKKKAAVSLLKEFEDNIFNPTEYDRNKKTINKLPPLLDEGEGALNCIFKYFAAYQSVFDNKSLSIFTQNLLKAMNFGFEAKFWKAPVVHYYAKFGDNKFDEFLNVLNRKFIADWLGELYITKRIENVCNIIEAIDKSTSADMVLQDEAFVFDNSLMIEIIDGPIYGKKYCRYLLLLISVILCGDETQLNLPEIVSIEHILPQNPKPESRWMIDFSEEQRNDCTNKIGNLMLISRRKNSALSNYDFDIKKAKYFDKNVGNFALSFKIYGKYQMWAYNDFLNNQKDIIDLLKKYFCL